MKLKQKLLLAVIATAFAAPAAFATDTNTAGQAVATSVKAVALIALSGTPAITCVAPTGAAAGAAMDCSTSVLAAKYKLTSNVASGASTGQTIKATVNSSSHSTNPTTYEIDSLGLQVAFANPVTNVAGTAVDLTSTTSAEDIVTGIKNVATDHSNCGASGCDVAYSFTKKAPSFTSSTTNTIGITYTISGDNT